ncbi:electron transport complex subunit RsxG [Vibrio sp. SCSIO 43136]|uniref:electron transport complex subunit RsxG n=1 Tax=Vibrio sp. SCSIO 43136 TaxID=2819101 RepID=UPI002075CC41|nr:electron transport complex subunit RsxG [Vibrio sp. SCSIO 43136]USD66100.1 electron transport complex subunit RsxG [Vibrio sp. SCSIO 43136]
MIKAIQKNGAVLALFALLSTGLVVATYALTKDQITYQKQQNLRKLLNEVIPEETHDNDLFKFCTLINNPKYLGTDESMPVYIARKKGYQTGLAIEAIAPDGYNGEIRILVGFTNYGAITGVRVLEHNETPGLGDKIDRNVTNWVDSFAGKRLNLNNSGGDHDGTTSATYKGPANVELKSLTMKEFQVKKDGGQFDGFTGATITPRAVVKAVKNVSIYYHQIARTISSRPLNCGEE